MKKEIYNFLENYKDIETIKKNIIEKMGGQRSYKKSCKKIW